MGVYVLSGQAKKLGETRAIRNGYYNDKGKLDTAHNEADALRHFAWNAMITRKYDQEVAKAQPDKKIYLGEW